VQQSNASTSNHATRHTHSQDTTATHPSGKLVNCKRLPCYEHCPGTFGYWGRPTCILLYVQMQAYVYVIIRRHTRQEYNKKKSTFIHVQCAITRND